MSCEVKTRVVPLGTLMCKFVALLRVQGNTSNCLLGMDHD